MPRANEQKIKLLVLYDILQRETDEEHPLSTNEIIERLSARGIEVSRKILPGDIALLNKYGFEILSYKKKSHYYYVAYRPFDIAELKVLIDAVQAATFISESKTEGLVNRLASMAGENQAEKLKQNFICYDIFEEYSSTGYNEVWTFVINFDEAEKYRKLRGGFLRKNQWRDLTVHVFV